MSNELWKKRSSTIRGEYMKSVISWPKMKNEEKEEFFKQFGIDIHTCVYCGSEANTLDHVYSTTRNSLFTGYTNDIKNLLPACSSCNSSKGNKDWDQWIYSALPKAEKARKRKGFEKRVEIIKTFIKKNKTKQTKLDDDIIKEINNNCLEFEKEMKNCFKRMDKLLDKHKEKLNELKKD